MAKKLSLKKSGRSLNQKKVSRHNNSQNLYLSISINKTFILARETGH